MFVPYSMKHMTWAEGLLSPPPSLPFLASVQLPPLSLANSPSWLSLQSPWQHHQEVARALLAQLKSCHFLIDSPFLCFCVAFWQWPSSFTTKLKQEREGEHTLLITEAVSKFKRERQKSNYMALPCNKDFSSFPGGNTRYTARTRNAML